MSPKTDPPNEAGKKSRYLAPGDLKTLETEGRDCPLFRRFLEGSERISLDGEEFFIVEGDLLLSEEELMLYCLHREASEKVRWIEDLREKLGRGTSQVGDVHARLVSVSDKGRPVAWKRGAVLTYCVLRRTFPIVEAYEEVVRNMREATSEWQSTCGIRFDYQSQHDTSPSLKTTFFVGMAPGSPKFSAISFFPNDPPQRRKLLLGADYLPGPYDRVGILRHEIGHILGFAHEHIRSGAPASCPADYPGAIVDLTKYDPKSVMHYFCGGVGSKLMEITEQDRAGAQAVYGPPL